MFVFLLKIIDKIEVTVHDKTIGLNTPETNVLTQNRFISCLVLIFSDLKKAHIYRIPYTDSSHHEIEIFMSFKYLNVFIPNEHREDCYNRGPNDKKFLFQIEDKKMFMWEKHYLVLKRLIR